MQGYRTYIVAICMMISGITARFGYNIDPNIVADAFIVLVPGVMMLMRAITTTPAVIGKQT